MVNSPKALFVAGPVDIIDEEHTYRFPHDPEVKRLLAKQDAIMNGAQGALFLAIDRESGKELNRIQLGAPPVWDGMAGARRQLIVCTMDGAVTCLRPR